VTAPADMKTVARVIGTIAGCLLTIGGLLFIVVMAFAAAMGNGPVWPEILLGLFAVVAGVILVHYCRVMRPW
jgi:hypothetical protein